MNKKYHNNLEEQVPPCDLPDKCLFLVRWCFSQAHPHHLPHVNSTSGITELQCKTACTAAMYWYSIKVSTSWIYSKQRHQRDHHRGQQLNTGTLKLICLLNSSWTVWQGKLLGNSTESGFQHFHNSSVLPHSFPFTPTSAFLHPSHHHRLPSPSSSHNSSSPSIFWISSFSSSSSSLRPPSESWSLLFTGHNIASWRGALTLLHSSAFLLPPPAPRLIKKHYYYFPHIVLQT